MKNSSKNLYKALAQKPTVLNKWKQLTPIAQRDFVRWVESAKQLETRNRRITRACSMLSAGKKRPCCYSIVPMSLYSALGGNKKAKEQWRSLTPTERRDIVGWIESRTDLTIQKERINKVCSALASGKRKVN